MRFLNLLIALGMFMSVRAQWAGSNNIRIDGSGNESQYVNSGNWYICWNNDSLFLFKSGGTSSDPAILFFDIDPVYPTTWGTNADGSVLGTPDFGVTANLPFRADLRIYWIAGSAPIVELRNGSNGWGSWFNIASADYANNGTDRELRIAWDEFPGLSARPSRFNFLAYCLDTSTYNSSGPTPARSYDAVDGNPNNVLFATPDCEYYWRCNNTSSTAPHNPFSYRSYTFLGTSGSLGNMGITSDIYDFCLNRSGTTVNKNGKWHFKGYMCVSDGVLEFDNNTDSLIVEDSLTIMGTGKLDMEGAGSKVWVKRHVTNRAMNTSGTDLKLSSNTAAQLIIGGNFKNYAGFEGASTKVIMHDHRSPQSMQLIYGKFSGDSAIFALEVDNGAGLRVWPTDSLVIKDELIMTDGKLDVDDGKYLRLRNGCDVTNTGGPSDDRFVEGWLSREIHGTDSTLFHVGDGNYLARVAIEPSSAQSGRTYTVRYIPSGHQYNNNYSASRVGSSGLDHASYVEHWKIFCNHTNDDAELTLFWTAPSLVSSDTSDWPNLRVSRWVGGTTNEWVIDGSNPFIKGSGTSDGYVDAQANTTVFTDSIFTIGSTTTPNPLPVELINFKANWVTEGWVDLRWQTAVEIDNLGFEVHYSSDAKHWFHLDWVDGKGNSNETAAYHRKYKMAPNNWHYFKLLQIDQDGKMEWHGPVVLAGQQTKASAIIYPNPCDDWLQVRFAQTNDPWRITDLSGKEVKSGIIKENKRISTVDLNGGMYYLHVNLFSGTKILPLYKQ